MTAQLIDGEATAAAIHGELRAEVEKLKAEHGIVPGLATVLVGENPASQAYVRSKQKRCGEIGIRSFGTTCWRAPRRKRSRHWWRS
jgi:methylenetetrahydrofolate dehydrogenase (NADP+)/methenyltetrahydrofolate cyclohydrolase